MRRAAALSYFGPTTLNPRGRGESTDTELSRFQPRYRPIIIMLAHSLKYKQTTKLIHLHKPILPTLLYTHHMNNFATVIQVKSTSEHNISTIYLTQVLNRL